MMISAVVVTHNRLAALKRCIESLKQPQIMEVIVIDNGSSPEVSEWLTTELRKYTKYQTLLLPDNQWGVVARNFGFQIAKGAYILQIDDDVTLHTQAIPEMLDFFEEDVIAVGPEGFLLNDVLQNPIQGTQPPVGAYVDTLTGYCWMFRNTQLWQYDWALAPFWFEEFELHLRMKWQSGLRLRKCGVVCTHYQERKGEIDHDLHDSHLNYVIQNYGPLIDKGKLKLETRGD